MFFFFILKLYTAAQFTSERDESHARLVLLCFSSLLSPFQRVDLGQILSSEFVAVAFNFWFHSTWYGWKFTYTGAVFIYLSKAFGSVDHDLLINKLESYGLGNTELDCFQSYLSDRKQVVSIGKETFYYCSITSGVPQGSILGPLLFVLFTNDLSKVLTQCQILMYADDTVMYFSATDSQAITYICDICLYDIL